MDRMHVTKIFIAVGETGSFAGAAQRLGVSPAVVSRSIAALERMLGVELLQRTTRNVRLTEPGRCYLDDVRDIVTELREASDAAAGAPNGQLVIATPASLSRSLVLPCVAEYLKRFPDVDVVAGFFDRAVDLAHEGVHVAVAFGRHRERAVVSTEAGHVRHVLCASAAYLERWGVPQHPAHLRRHAVIGLGTAAQPADWAFSAAEGAISMSLTPRITVTTTEAAIEAAGHGLGVARVLSHQAAGPVAEGRLRVVLDRYSELPQPVCVLRRERYREVPKVSQFVHILVEHLRCNLTLSRAQHRSFRGQHRPDV